MLYLLSRKPDCATKVRADKIAERLEQIRSGEAPALLAEVDARERDRSTWCVGVRWEYERQDLADIVRVCLYRSYFRQALIHQVTVSRWSGSVSDLPRVRRRLRASSGRRSRPHSVEAKEEPLQVRRGQGSR